jgi:hypothetical protein
VKVLPAIVISLLTGACAASGEIPTTQITIDNGKIRYVPASDIPAPGQPRGFELQNLRREHR